VVEKENAAGNHRKSQSLDAVDSRFCVYEPLLYS
jgi:hypothetical protein